MSRVVSASDAERRGRTAIGTYKPGRIYWDHNLDNPIFWRICQCGAKIGPFKKVSVAQSVYCCDRCNAELDKLLRDARGAGK